MPSRKHIESTVVIFASLASATLVLISSPVASAADDQPAKRAEAEKHAKAGARLMRLGLFERALPELEAAFDLTGGAADGLLAVECARRVGDLDRAYNDVIRVRDRPKLSKKDVAAVAATVTDLEDHTGLVVVTAPPGASVEVGGQVIGIAPLARSLRQPVGPAVVRVTSPAMTPWERVVDVPARGQVKVMASLSPAKSGGYLYVVESVGLPVHVFLDGQDAGPTPWHASATAGSHELVLKGKDLVSVSSLIELEAGTQQAVTLTAKPTVGHIHITVTPRAAHVIVDDQTVGTGQWDVDLPVGKHTLGGALPGYVPASRAIDVASGVKADIGLSLEPEPPPKYTGFYGAFDVGYLDPVASHDLASSGAGYAGAITLHLGYNTGYIGIEGVLAPHGGYFEPGSGSNPLSEFGGFLGAGPRITSHGSFVRFTFGVQGGAEMREYIETVTIPSGQPGNSLQFSPAVMTDLGLLLGSTPGVKFFIGPKAYTYFPLGQVSLYSSPQQLTLATGPTLSIGGFVGVFFGR